MAGGRILDEIETPAALKCLSNEELAILANELREEIVNTCAHTGGHVASSLGAVDIIVACHSVLNCPQDKLVFDVGHQSYAHKLLTGRKNEFHTLRSLGGISGFPKPGESEYDAHPSGHASDSLSVALGLAKARDMRGSNEKIVAIIGDAAIAGGMAFEALNHIGQAQTPLVIILNDNEMSISRNVGALMKHFGAVRASASYQQTRDSMQDALEQSNAGRALVQLGRNMKDSMKQFFLGGSMIYEQLGILCTTPINGHNIALLREILQTALNANAPVLVHVVTKKGQGYEPALRNPVAFHGIGAFDVATGRALAKAHSTRTYTQVFGEELLNCAAADKRIVAITAAMKTGTGLEPFAREYPSRFIDTGITEGHAIGLAAGLAFGGMKPVVALYSTFLQRGFDQTIIDVALSQLNVVFAIDRAGLVGEDGPTHHGLFDMAYMRMIPNMRVVAPSSGCELRRALRCALSVGGPFAIRYPRGEAAYSALEGCDSADTEADGVQEMGRVQEAGRAQEAGGAQEAGDAQDACTFEVGRARTLRQGSDVSLLAFGRMVQQALKAAEILEANEVHAQVVDMRWAKPVDVDAISSACTTQLVVTLEEGVVAGGAGSAVIEAMACENLQTPVLQLGIPDTFVSQGSTSELLCSLNLHPQGIANAVLERLQCM